jgi:hypothetical protein
VTVALLAVLAVLVMAGGHDRRLRDAPQRGNDDTVPFE